jgi:ligand-binding sensor domain-containing protein
MQQKTNIKKEKLMKKIVHILITLIVIMTLSACNSGANNRSSEEENSSNTPANSSENNNTASTQNLQDIDLSVLGETEIVADGGFSFRPIIGYELNISGGMVSMIAPGADSDVGPIFQLMGWNNETQKTNDQLYEQLKNETDMQVGAPGEIKVAGLQGISADITGENNGKPMQGRVAMVMVNDTQQFIMMMGSPQTDYEIIAPYFNALVASITFNEIVSMPPTSDLESGKYVFTNGNEVKDLIVNEEVVYAATMGGFVTWRLDSGYSMHYTPLDGMGHANAYSVTYCEIPEPRILVGTSSGISIYDPNTGLWDQKSLAPEESGVGSSRIDRLYCDQPNNRLLIGYYGLGILDLSTGAFQQYNDKSGLLWNAVSDITVNGKDIWIANGHKGISQISGEKITNYSLENNIPDERANALAFSKDGTLWVGASKGLMSFKGGKWTLYGSDSPAKIADITELEISADGKIWAATASMGGGNLCQFNIATADCDVKVEDVDYQGFVAMALS